MAAVRGHGVSEESKKGNGGQEVPVANHHLGQEIPPGWNSSSAAEEHRDDHIVPLWCFFEATLQEVLREECGRAERPGTESHFRNETRSKCGEELMGPGAPRLQGERRGRSQFTEAF